MVTEERIATQESDSGSFATPVRAGTYIAIETSVGSSVAGGSKVQTSNESNFVRVSASSSVKAKSSNVVLAKEKSPYAVTLHNVDKFELLTELKVGKG